MGGIGLSDRYSNLRFALADAYKLARGGDKWHPIKCKVTLNLSSLDLKSSAEIVGKKGLICYELGTHIPHLHSCILGLQGYLPDFSCSDVSHHKSSPLIIQITFITRSPFISCRLYLCTDFYHTLVITYSFNQQSCLRIQSKNSRMLLSWIPHHHLQTTLSPRSQLTSTNLSRPAIRSPRLPNHVKCVSLSLYSVVRRG